MMTVWIIMVVAGCLLVGSVYMIVRNTKVFTFRMAIIDLRYAGLHKLIPKAPPQIPPPKGREAFLAYIDNDIVKGTQFIDDLLRHEDLSTDLYNEFESISYAKMLYSFKNIPSFFEGSLHESMGFVPSDEQTKVS